MRRVFSKPICAAGTMTAANEIQLSAASWEPEEDIVIIGVQAFCHITDQNQNDGYAYMWCMLSQSGQMLVGGEIYTCMICDYWNTVPSGIQIINDNGVYMLPEDHGIPIPEGTSVHIHTSGSGKSAGATNFCADFTIFYVKGKLSQLRRG